VMYLKYSIRVRASRKVCVVIPAMLYHRELDS